jgi:hypothetical protein
MLTHVPRRHLLLENSDRVWSCPYLYRYRNYIDIDHIESTEQLIGDLLREEIAAKSQLGRQARKILGYVTCLNRCMWILLKVAISKQLSPEGYV